MRPTLTRSTSASTAPPAAQSRVSFHRPGVGLGAFKPDSVGSSDGGVRVQVHRLGRARGVPARLLHRTRHRRRRDRACAVPPRLDDRPRRVLDAATTRAGRGLRRGRRERRLLRRNLAYWQIRSLPERAAIVCHKRGPDPVEVGRTGGEPLDPHYRPRGTAEENRLTTVQFHSTPVAWPPNSLTGLSNRNDGADRAEARRGDGRSVFAGAMCWWEKVDGPPRPGGRLRRARAGHWAFFGTAVEAGDVFGRDQKLVGFECDGLDYDFAEGGMMPSGRDGSLEDLTVLALADCRDWGEVDFSATPPSRVPGRTLTARELGRRRDDDRAPAAGPGHRLHRPHDRLAVRALRHDRLHRPARQAPACPPCVPGRVAHHEEVLEQLGR
jgi:hypothetical protein